MNCRTRYLLDAEDFSGWSKLTPALMQIVASSGEAYTVNFEEKWVIMLARAVVLPAHGPPVRQTR
jgi:hypothetical protein